MGSESGYPELTTVKVVHSGIARRVKVPYDMEWKDFERKVCRLFSISPPLVTSYKDSMGVSVIVDNSEDFFFFLDEEYTGRLDILTNVDASENSEWTVVRTDAGKSLKDVYDNASEGGEVRSLAPTVSLPSTRDSSSEVSIASPTPSVHVEATAPFEKSYPEPEVYISPQDSSAAAEADLSAVNNETQTVGEKEDELSASLDKLKKTDDVEPYVEKEAIDTNDVCASVSKQPSPAPLSPNLSEGNEASSLLIPAEPEAVYAESNNDINSPNFDDPRSFSDAIEFNDASVLLSDKPIEVSVDECLRSKSRSSSISSHSEKAHLLQESPLLNEIQVPEKEGYLHFSDDESVTSSIIDNDREDVGRGEEDEDEEEEDGEKAKEEEEDNEAVERQTSPKGAGTPPDMEFRDFAEALVYKFFTPGSSSPSSPKESLIPSPRAVSPILKGQTPEDLTSAPTKNTGENSDEYFDESLERLKKTHSLRQLCHKFNDIFRRTPALLMTVELFIDQIDHGVPIDLGVLEASLNRVTGGVFSEEASAPNPARVLEGIATNLVGNVGNLIDRLGSTLNTFIENDLSQFVATQLQRQFPEPTAPTPTTTPSGNQPLYETSTNESQRATSSRSTCDELKNEPLHEKIIVNEPLPATSSRSTCEGLKNEPPHEKITVNEPLPASPNAHTENNSDEGSHHNHTCTRHRKCHRTDPLAPEPLGHRCRHRRDKTVPPPTEESRRKHSCRHTVSGNLEQHHNHRRNKRKSHNCPSPRDNDLGSAPYPHPMIAICPPKPPSFYNDSPSYPDPTIAICPPKPPSFHESYSPSYTGPTIAVCPPMPPQNDDFSRPAPRIAICPTRPPPPAALLERNRNPYSWTPESQPQEPYRPMSFDEAISGQGVSEKQNDDLGGDINPADVALIEGIVSLRAMGFHNDSANLDALQSNEGNLEKAIDHLLARESENLI